MPSPTLITVPTSITVTPASKFSICRRMMSLISFALIGSMIHFRFTKLATEARRHRGNAKESHWETEAGYHPQNVFSFLRVSVPLWQSSCSRHFLLNHLQLIAYRAVVNGRADPRDNAADQIRIDGIVD